MTKNILTMTILIILFAQTTWATQAPPLYFTAAASEQNIPVELPLAIARVESGNVPWALNIEGKGYLFGTKQEAVSKATEAAEAGKSFDSGLMQINNFWLKKYNIPIEAAFDPQANVFLGSWILKQEIKSHGDNWLGVGAYHSTDPARSRNYIELVKKAIESGPEKTKDEKDTISVSSQKDLDFTPIIVARHGQKIDSSNQNINVIPFVQRLNKN